MSQIYVTPVRSILNCHKISTNKSKHNLAMNNNKISYLQENINLVNKFMEFVIKGWLIPILLLSLSDSHARISFGHVMTQYPSNEWKNETNSQMSGFQLTVPIKICWLRKNQNSSIDIDVVHRVVVFWEIIYQHWLTAGWNNFIKLESHWILKLFCEWWLANRIFFCHSHLINLGHSINIIFLCREYA